MSKLARDLVVLPPNSQTSSSLSSTEVAHGEVHCFPLEITTMSELVFLFVCFVLFCFLPHALFSVFVDLSFLIIASNTMPAASPC